MPERSSHPLPRPTLLTMEGVSKSLLGVRVLLDVSLGPEHRTVADNVFLGGEPTRHGLVAPRAVVGRGLMVTGVGNEQLSGLTRTSRSARHALAVDGLDPQPRTLAAL